VGAAEREQAEVDLLLAELTAAREDDRSFQTEMATIVGVVIALLAALAALVGQICPPGTPSTQAAPCTPVSPWVIALGPAVPLAMFAFLAMQGSAATIRAYYVRAVEAELRDRVTVRAPGLGGTPLPALSGITLEAISLRRGRRTYRLVAATVFLAVLLVLGGLSVHLLSQLSAPWGITAGVLYALALVPLLVQAWTATVRGRAYFDDVLDTYRHGARPRSRERGERSVAGYLLLPRPQDLVKWAVLPATFGFAVAITGAPGAAATVRAVVVWLVLEYLVYQARYQVNDVRGFVADQTHPSRQDRRRLPGPLGAARVRTAQSLTVAALRLVVAAGVVLVLPGLHLAAPVAVGAAVVLVSMVPYEVLRGREDRAGPSDGSQPAPALWWMIGTGYALRGVLGVALAVPAGVEPLVAVLCLVTLGATGVVFVTLTWALEATSLAATAEPPAGRPDPAAYRYAGPAHLVGLSRYFRPGLTGSDVDEVPPGAPGADVEHPHATLRHWHPVRRGSAWDAPWNLAVVPACSAAAALGVALAGGAGAAVVACVLVGAVTGVGLSRTRGRGRLGWLVAGCASVTAYGWGAGMGVPPVAAVPLVAAGGLYVAFVTSSWDSLKRAASELAHRCAVVAGSAARGALRTVVGPSTWALVRSGSDGASGGGPVTGGSRGSEDRG
jgi:hypothetical protein